MDSWSTPSAPRPVDVVVTLPGSKSITARALVLAALADGPSRLVRPLRARDTDLMAAGLRALGVEVTEDGADWLVVPGPLRGPATSTPGWPAPCCASCRRSRRWPTARSPWTATSGCASGPTPG